MRSPLLVFRQHLESPNCGNAISHCGLGLFHQFSLPLLPLFLLYSVWSERLQEQVLSDTLSHLEWPFYFPCASENVSILVYVVSEKGTICKKVKMKRMIQNEGTNGWEWGFYFLFFQCEFGNMCFFFFARKKMYNFSSGLQCSWKVCKSIIVSPVGKKQYMIRTILFCIRTNQSSENTVE